MKNMKLNAITLALTGAIGLAACGTDPTTTQNAAAPKTTTGVITGFGSVFVNGVEYETTGASVEKDGVTGLDESALKVGMVVTLDGSVNADGSTGSALAIKFADEVEGLVLANNIALDNTLDVMGQTVQLDAETTFESYDATHLSPADIPLNARVEVSGYSDGAGNIYATRVEVKQNDPTEDMELKGVVSALDANAMTFMIGSLSIDYSSASEVPTGIADGLYVEVKSDTAPASGVLSATKVEIEDDGEKGEKGDEGEEMEIEGVITAVVSDSEISLNGQTVLISGDTEYDDGASAADLLAGTKIKVEGSFNADGVLVAEEVKLKKAGDIEIDAYVEAVDAASNSITVLGQMIQVNNHTTMQDERDQNGATPERYFGVADLAVNDWVELKVYKDAASGAMIATVLERDDDESKPVALEGTVESLPAAGEAVVSGFAVTVPDSATAGLANPLAVDMKVEITGTYSGGVFTATQVSVDG